MVRTPYDLKDLGSGVIGGVECDWLAFRTDEVDWQVWITQDTAPRPCRYTITTKTLEHSPEYTIEFRDWRTGDAAAGDFTFDPAGATKIEPAAIKAKMSDLPDHFATRGGQ